ncbi:uncharacterized protein LOC121735157 [Aricia agestis]|uniref:uncharacterized protein LOC121735157 n=1 Tax=Aricia agestis TaxID=91739 RepID=UPI001C208811|nr:uncharacterized protein LOC121735157 [Aricia agestis]
MSTVMFTGNVPATLDLDSLQKIHDELKKNTTNSTNSNKRENNARSVKNSIEGDTIASLKYTAVQTCDIFDKVLQNKSYALRCLALTSVKLTNDFYQHVLDSISDIIESTAKRILRNYIKTSTNAKHINSILNTLMICLMESEMEFSIFENFEPHEWRIEMLTYSLFSAWDVDFNTRKNLIDKMNNMESINYNKHSTYSIEDVLDIILSSEVDVYFFSDLLNLMEQNPDCLDVIRQNILLTKFPLLQYEIEKMKTHYLSEYFNLFDNTDNNIDLKYLTKYPCDVLNILLSKTPNELNDLERLLELSLMDMTKRIKLLLKLKKKESILKWKYEIVFEIVKERIAIIFSSYKEYLQLQRNVSENLFLPSQFTISCTCYISDCRFHKTTECCDLLYNLNCSIARVMFNCMELSECTINLVDTLILKFMSSEKIIQVIKALDIVEDYEIKFKEEELDALFSKIFSCTNFDREVHEYVVQKYFTGSYEKTVDQLLGEIERETDSVVDMFDKVQSCYKKSSVLFREEVPINNWDEKQLRMWSKLARCQENTNKIPDEEILAVIKAAAKNTLNLQLRHIQLISVILMIKSNKGKGRLSQINTGEGKTLIIAILAAYNVLKGHTVDVYTSSALLAIPQSKKYGNFYSVLNITITHNIEYNSDYDKDVIYGTNHSFQRDVLRDEFRKSGVRKNRKFDIAIVDEVDNMLIDGNNWTLKMRSDMPVMDYLEVLLAAIYIQVNEAARSLIQKDGKTYYLVQETPLNDDGSVKPKIDVEEVEIKGSIKSFIMECTNNHMRKLIRDVEHCKNIEKGYPEIKIPNHLREVICKVQLEKWISNAISARFQYVKDEDYILKNGKIIIVDADNTGALQLNSSWSNGLHQFLQIKHGARVEPENFTSNFISNVALFNRYVSKVYGLTGTLGSAEAKSFLQNTYNVDSVVVPPFKLKQHKHLKPIMINNKENRYEEIAKSCIRKLSYGQAALIIIKYIREAEELRDIFLYKFNYDSSKVKLVKTDDDSEILEKLLNSGEVIITTNIAGRGTDINLSKDVEQNGGLHVCLTFLPLNSRVEHQNIGRTSRKGNKGTSQLVIHDPQGFGEIKAIRALRDKKEANAMSQASETVKKIKTKDTIFRSFCEILNKIVDPHNDLQETYQTAAEERFAIWLVINTEHGIEKDVHERFETFKKEILNDYQNNCLIKNPCMYINLGNKYLAKKEYEKAILKYNQAIILDKNFSEFAYYNRARSYLAKYGSDMKENEHFINEAIKDLENTRKLIVEKEYALHLLQTASQGEVFSEQVSHKLNLYNYIKNTIDLAIGPDVKALNEQTKRITEELKKPDLETDVKSKLEESLKELNEYKKETGTIGRAKCKSFNISVDSIGKDFIPSSDLESHKQELQELKMNGWLDGFKVTEIKPIDWYAVTGLLFIGLGQLIIGAALTVFTLGAGATIGMGLIGEGVSDIITAVKDGIFNRDFDWATWALMKAISIAVTVCCAGLKAIKDVAKTAYAGAKNVVTSGVKCVTQTTKEGWVFVAKKIGLDLAKGVAKEIVTDLVAYSIDKTILPMIEEILIDKVREPIQEALLNNSKVAKMLQFDVKNGNHNFENEIRSIAQKLLTPKEYSKLRTIAMTIVTQVEDKKGLTISRQVCTGLEGMYELATFTSNFISKLLNEINSIKVDLEADKNDVAHINKTQSEETAIEVYHHNNEFKDSENYIDLSKAHQAEEQIKLDKKPQSTSNLSSEIAGMVSSNMIQILKGKIVTPVVQMGANYTIDQLSSNVSRCLDGEIENYRSMKNIINSQNKLSKNKNNSKPALSKQEEKTVDKIIDDLNKGGPAGLIHLGAISTVTDHPIEVYDEKGRHKYTIGDDKKSKPIQIQYNAPEDGSDVGHFTLKGQREPSRKSDADNMCLFNVIAEQTGKNPNDLKNETLNVMKNNKVEIAKQVKHMHRLQMYDRSRLLEGGAQYNGKRPKDAKHFIRNSCGVKGFKNKNKGHADIHFSFEGKTQGILDIISEESKHPIEIYDSEGNLSYTVGEKNGKPPIKIRYDKHTSKNSGGFCSLDGKVKYNLHDLNDMNFYKTVSDHTGCDAKNLKKTISSNMDAKPAPATGFLSDANGELGFHYLYSKMDAKSVPASRNCVENESLKCPKTGFLSEEDGALVFHYAMQTEKAKKAMEELNKYGPGSNKITTHRRQEVLIAAKDLNLPSPVYGGSWENGKLIVSWPVTDVMLVLQHYDGHQYNKNARAHIQTFYPCNPMN